MLPDLIVSADELRLQQALGNLMANALSHTPRGGRILVSAAIDTPRQLILSVADFRCRFSDNFIERAFDRFARADTGRSRRAGGAGLGLAIVKSIVEAHGGFK